MAVGNLSSFQITYVFTIKKKLNQVTIYAYLQLVIVRKR